MKIFAMKKECIIKKVINIKKFFCRRQHWLQRFWPYISVVIVKSIFIMYTTYMLHAIYFTTIYFILYIPPVWKDIANVNHHCWECACANMRSYVWYMMCSGAYKALTLSLPAQYNSARVDSVIIWVISGVTPRFY